MSTETKQLCSGIVSDRSKFCLRRDWKSILRDTVKVNDSAAVTCNHITYKAKVTNTNYESCLITLSTGGKLKYNRGLWYDRTGKIYRIRFGDEAKLGEKFRQLKSDRKT